MNDVELEREWRRHSTGLPSSQLDEAIRAAARRAVRRRLPWQRYLPLAAAASVGVIAFLLVRQTPNPAPAVDAPAAVDVPIAREARESTPGSLPEAPSTPVTAESGPAIAAAPQAAKAAQAPAEARAPAGAPALPDTPAFTARQAATTAAPAAAPLRSIAAAVADQATARLPPQIEALVKADAARRAGIEPDQVTIVAFEAVTWSDGALDCRRPGELAIQVLTPGYRIEVEAAASQLVYHTDTRAELRVCNRVPVPDAP